MIRDAYSLNPYIGREMMDYATNEQIAAAPAELMLAAVYNRDSRAAFTWPGRALTSQAGPARSSGNMPSEVTHGNWNS
jgi:hypothetical protein